MKEQLQRIGVECPVTHYDPRRPLLRHALVDIDTLERLVATLAEEVAATRACVLAARRATDADSMMLSLEPVDCRTYDGGTGRRQA